MRITFLLANPGARFATNAFSPVGDGHYLFFVLFILVVIRIDRDSLPIFVDANQFQHVARADLEATAATYAFLFVDGANKSRRPQFAAGQSDSESRHVSCRHGTWCGS